VPLTPDANIPPFEPPARTSFPRPSGPPAGPGAPGISSSVDADPPSLEPTTPQASSSPDIGADADARARAFQPLEVQAQAFAAPAGPVALSTTGVPHYGPPAPPPFSYGPGIPAGETAIWPPRRPRSFVRPVVRGVRELAETIILALLIFLLVRAVVQNFQVEGSSMDPTFKDGWYLLVNKAIYWEINLDTVHKFVPFVEPGDDPTRFIFRGPQRGDIIVFHPPTESGEPSDRDFIKRVIALPNETVEVHDCTVFIDGKALEEPYLTQPVAGDFEPFTVPPDQYFVMGDNRNNSSDSRSFHAVPKENIIGMAWLTYWPFDIFGLVDNHAEKPGDVSSPPKTPIACPSSGTP
jgi:signal peptidase I